MKKIIILSLICLFLFPKNIYAKTETDENTSESDLTPNATSAIMIEASTGEILYEKNANEKLAPASMTKMMSMLLIMEQIEKGTLSWDEQVTVSENASSMGGSQIFLETGEKMSVQDLLKGISIASGNDATVAMAERIAGSEDAFVKMMNERAKELGLTSTNFKNATGLDDENHYSTAHDMALIAQYCMKNEVFRQIVSKTSYTLEPTNKTSEERYFVTTNDLIKPSSEYYYPYCIGIKTGYTSQAKNCLISASKKDGLELISVVLGATTTNTGKSARNTDSITLFDYGFENYTYQQILTQNSVVTNLTINNATKETKDLPLVTQSSISSLVPANIDLNSIEPIISINEIIEAPISEGDVLGTIKYNIDGIEYSTNLCAEHSVEKFDIYLLAGQIIAVIIILIVLYKILSFNNRNKKKYCKKKNKYSSRKKDSIYKF